MAIGIFLIQRSTTNSGVQIEHMVLGHQMVTKEKHFKRIRRHLLQDPTIKRSKKLCVQ